EDRPRGGLPPDARRAVVGAAAGRAAVRAGTRGAAPLRRRRARLTDARVRRAVERDDERAPLGAGCGMVNGPPSAAAVWAALDELPDPEIPVISLVELGVVRDVRVDGAHVSVTLTPTFLGCPALDAMRRALESKLAELGAEPVVEIDRCGRWTTDSNTPARRD